MTGAMEPYRVTLEARFSRGTVPGRDYRGRCYEMPFKYLAAHRDEPALRLVHGTVHPLGRPTAHAWVERLGRWVFDPWSQGFYDRDAYYRELQADAARVYTATEAREWGRQEGHYGP